MNELMKRAERASKGGQLAPGLNEETRDMLLVLIRQYFDTESTTRPDRQRCIEAARHLGGRSEAIGMAADIDSGY